MKDKHRSRCPLKNILYRHNVHYKPMNKATINRNCIKIKNSFILFNFYIKTFNISSWN